MRGLPSLCLLLCVAALAEATEIKLREQCDCASGLVMLEDVAEIAAGKAEGLGIGRVVLFPAPQGGEQRIVNRRQVLDILHLRGVATRDLRITGANVVRVHGRSVKPAQETEVQQTRQEQSELAVVPVRAIGRGEIIGPDDVQLRAVSSQPAGVAREPGDLIGREATQSLKLGQPVHSQHVRTLRMIKRNDLVTIFVRTGGVQVRTNARAMEDGGRGDLIRLQSLLDRNAQFTARVTGFREAEIYAGGAGTAKIQPTAFRENQREEKRRRAAMTEESRFGLRVKNDDPRHR